MKIIMKLEKQHIIQLHKLYQKEWWTDKRTLDETQKCVKNSQIVIAIIDDKHDLIAFVRVLTDFTFKAIIFDLIVSKEHRGKGIGKELLTLVSEHKELQDVKHFELYALPEMFALYEKFGFSDALGDLKLMRMEK